MTAPCCLTACPVSVCPVPLSAVMTLLLFFDCSVKHTGPMLIACAVASTVTTSALSSRDDANTAGTNDDPYFNGTTSHDEILRVARSAIFGGV